MLAQIESGMEKSKQVHEMNMEEQENYQRLNTQIGEIHEFSSLSSPSLPVPSHTDKHGSHAVFEVLKNLGFHL